MSEQNVKTAIATLFENEMTENGLQLLRKKFPADVVHDMSDEAQFKAGRKTRTEMNKLLEQIKTRRINVTSEIKTMGDELSSEIELIYSSVVGPYLTQLEVNKAAKEKAERELKELLDGQRLEINELNKLVSDSIGKSSQSISGTIQAIESVDTSMFHKDIIHEAIEVKENVKIRLGELLTQALNEESLQIQREELEAKQAELDRQLAAMKATQQEPVAEQVHASIGQSVSEAAPSLLGATEVKEPVFKSMEMNASLNESFERETMAMFFGSENISNASTDRDGNEYNLEVIVRRTSIK